MLLEQPFDRRLAWLTCLGRCRCNSPKLKKPRGGEVIGERQHLRAIPPELMMHALAQPNPFLPQFLGKARPRAQFDATGIRNMETAE